MKNQYHILQSFYHYNSEVMPTLNIEKQSEIIKRIPSDKTLTFIHSPVARKVLKDGFNIQNKSDFDLVSKKKLDILITESMRFVALIYIYLNEKENFVNLDPQTVLDEYITTDYIQNKLVKQLYILNDIWSDWDFVKKNGSYTFYVFLQNKITNTFKNKDQLIAIANMFEKYESLLETVETTGIIGFLISTWLRLLELGNEAKYISTSEYNKNLEFIGQKVNWVFYNWNDYIISLVLGAIISDEINLYYDIIPLNRLLYNIKTILQYNHEMLDNIKIWDEIDVPFLTDFINDVLLDMTITKTSYLEFLSYKNNYINEALKASYVLFEDVFIPLATKHNIILYFINDDKNSFLNFPKNPFEEEINLEKIHFLNNFQPAELPLVWDEVSTLTNMGIWTTKKFGFVKADNFFIDKNEIIDLNIKLKNDLTFEIRKGRVTLLTLSPVPERFNLSIEDFYLSSKKDIKNYLKSELANFENFFKELYKQLG